MSSQMVIPTGTPATTKGTMGPSPGMNHRCSSKTP